MLSSLRAARALRPPAPLTLTAAPPRPAAACPRPWSNFPLRSCASLCSGGTARICRRSPRLPGVSRRTLTSGGADAAAATAADADTAAATAADADAAAATAADPTTKPTGPNARFNELKVQQLSDQLHAQIFPNRSSSPNPALIKLSEEHLKRHDLLGKVSDEATPISFDVPALQGDTLDEHFQRLGQNVAEPYLTIAKDFATVDLPDPPKEWKQGNEWASGWTKYPTQGTPVKVEAPDEEMLVFDVEVLYKESPFAVMACAAGKDAWYAWVSPWLLGDKSDRHLVPLGDPGKERIIVGHNVGYDRARVKEEYNIKQTKNAFLDTMSLHVAVNGMCSRQRPTWMKHAKNRELRERYASETDSSELAKMLENTEFGEPEEELWVGRSSINSLRDVAKFHCEVEIDKAARDQFGVLKHEEVAESLEELLAYCANDVLIAHKVYKAIFPRFLEVCPHPVSFAALRHLSSVTLPVNRNWESYIVNAEKTYQTLLGEVQSHLEKLAEHALELKKKPEEYQGNDWLSQLDWTGQEPRLTKSGAVAARQKKPGEPKWYKDLFPKTNGPINLTVRTRIAPLLLNLSWQGNPLIWSDKHGWVFRVPCGDADDFKDSPVVRVEMRDDPKLRDDDKNTYFKLPHKDGPQARVVNPLAKGYLQYFESGVLSSSDSLAKKALEMNSACSYWISARERIVSQMVVYQRDVPLDRDASGNPVALGRDTSEEGIKGAREENEEPAHQEIRNEEAPSMSPLEPGLILPQLIPMGTITRRAVEKTWLTASNAKKNRVGSELKAMVTAPPGYAFVGADVDSQELWIASLIGDAVFGLHGGNAIGFMTLEGSKAAGTDMHSRTASILGISRNNAKIFNYGRIYGAGLKFAATLLRQFNPSISDAAAMATAQNLYNATKGTKANRQLLSPRKFWHGGSESFVFNKLEEFADQEWPRTPVLGAGLTEALMRRFISKNGFLTSRINWAIQSSGVDYLHLLIVSMDYLIRVYGLDARLSITVHDEIRYLVKWEERYKLAMALQTANLWTRAMFAQQMGIDDLPQSCAFFSAVDIDHVLRKEVDMDCITPSQPKSIPPGESIDMEQLLAKGDEAALVPKNEVNVRELPVNLRTPILETLESPGVDTPQGLAFIRAQIVQSEGELRGVVADLRKNLALAKPQSDEEKAAAATKATEHEMMRVKEIEKGWEEQWLTLPKIYEDSKNQRKSGVRRAPLNSKRKLSKPQRAWVV